MKGIADRLWVIAGCIPSVVTRECWRLLGRAGQLADAEEDEVAALTPGPASSEGWTQRRWALHYREHGKALHDRIVELQAQAGVSAKIEKLEQGS